MQNSIFGACIIIVPYKGSQPPYPFSAYFIRHQNLPDMKKVSLPLCILFLFSFTLPADELSKKDRKFAQTSLEETRDDLKNTIAGLSEEQFNFKPGPDRWSVKECLQHIAAAETQMWQTFDQLSKAAANPDKRAEIKMSDEQILKTITDRSFKATAPESMRPVTSPYQTALDAWNGFLAERDKRIKQVKNMKADLRNHVTQTPLGWIDSFQWILFISGHSNRHTQQIAEVMADANFPKS